MTVELPAPLLRALSALWLGIVWVALWGAPTVGTAAAGALLGVGVTFAASASTHHTATAVRLRPLALLRLGGVFAVMLVTSTAGVVRLVLSRRLRLRSAVLTVTLPPAPAGLVTLVANAVTLTPGTLALDAERRPDGTTLLYVHGLDVTEPGAVRRDVQRLLGLATAAFGPSAAPGDPRRS